MVWLDFTTIESPAASIPEPKSARLLDPLLALLEVNPKVNDVGSTPLLDVEGMADIPVTPRSRTSVALRVTPLSCPVSLLVDTPNIN
jgi:hypothetical protein